MTTFLLALFIVICILLIVVVLLQKGRGGGLGGALGGGMTSSAFGTRTGDVFTWVTVVLTSLFLLLAIITTVMTRPADVAIMPGFSPASGPIEKETPVSIVIPSKQDVRVYYTLDGSDPTDKSVQYLKQPVKVKPGQTIKARTYRLGKAGPMASAFFGRPDQYPKEVPPTPATGAATSLAAESAPASAPAGGASTAPSPSPTTRPARGATTRPTAAETPAPAPTSAPAAAPALP
jgi:preprotein translocase subunit SecG